MLNRNNFAIAKLATADTSRYGASRYGLNSIRVEHDRTVVTDGRLLLVMTGDSVPESAYPIIPGFNPTTVLNPIINLSRETALAIAKAIPKTKLPALNHAVIGTNSDGDAAIATTDLSSSQTFKAIDGGGSFPNYGEVIPAKSEATAVISFDPRLMVALLQSMDSVYENGGQHSVVMWIKDAVSPILIECKHEEQKATGILMPVKLDTSEL